MPQGFSNSVWSWSGELQPANKKPTASLRDLMQGLEGDHRRFLTYYLDGQRIRQWSFHEYFEAARALVFHCEQRLGFALAVGDRVAVSSMNSDSLLIVYAACFLRGLTVVPINPGESDQSIARIVEHAKCRVLIAGKARSTLPCRILLFEELFSIDCKYGEIQPAADLGQMPDAESAAAIFYTSGTTSAPKGVVLSHRAILANAEALKAAHRLTESSVHYCVLPLYHVNAFGFSFLTNLAARSQLVLSNRFQAQNFWETLVAESCQTCNVVPEVISQLITKTDPNPQQLRQARHTMRYFVSAASALSRDWLVRFSEKFSIKIVQGYGLSETVNFSLLVSPYIDDDEYATVMLASSRPSAGSAVDGNDVSVRRLTDDEPCGPGEVGEIAVRGWNVMTAYLDNPGETERAFRSGWFHTGDLGYYRVIADKKYFYISGRLKEIVKRNSETIYVQDVEECLQTLPGCSESAVTGFPNRWTGEELGAVVVRQATTPDAEAILRASVRVLGYDKAPKVVRFVDKIPRTGSLKVKRRALSDLFADMESTKFSR